MWRLVAHGLLLVVLTPPNAAAGALPAAPPSCDDFEPSFGVRLDGSALERGALDGIYVDGAVALPVQLGLRVSNVRDPSELVARKLVTLDVTDPSGAPLNGSVELVLPSLQSMVAEPAWLVWVGENAFEPNTSYEVQYSFVNDQITSCPQAVPVAGVTTFTTGERSAADDLVDASVFLSTADLHSAAEPNAGCCNVTDATSCQTEDSCVACWESMLVLKDAFVKANFGLPGAYFTLDLSLLAGERPQPISTGSQYLQEASASFAITDSALEYCFHADLRPRANVDARISTSRCVNAFGLAIFPDQPKVDAIPADACAEEPQLTQTALLFARFGQSEDEARAALPPGFRNRSEEATVSGGCAIGSHREASGGREWLLGLLIAAGASARRVRRPAN